MYANVKLPKGRPSQGTVGRLSHLPAVHVFRWWPWEDQQQSPAFSEFNPEVLAMFRASLMSRNLGVAVNQNHDESWDFKKCCSKCSNQNFINYINFQLLPSWRQTHQVGKKKHIKPSSKASSISGSKHHWGLRLSSRSSSVVVVIEGLSAGLWLVHRLGAGNQII